jgi:perosamine synthetase
MRIPLSAPDITEADIDAVAGVLRSGRLSLGPKLEEFENAVAGYVRAAHAVGVSSGTAGLHLCVKALGIREGDEVILPSFTFIAAANAVCYERAVPVFVDIDPVTLNIDPAKMEAAISPRTRAILVPHTFGIPAPMNEILAVAGRHRLSVIEDACEAIGAEIYGKKVGAMGDAGVFAFYPNKQITTAEGGVVVSNSEELAARLRTLRNQGRSPWNDWLQHTEVGYNYRLSELHSALGVEQMKRIEPILKRRDDIARAYGDGLKDLETIELPPFGLTNYRVSWFVFVVRLRTELMRIHRDVVAERLAEKGIETGRYFGPIHLQPAYRGRVPPRTPLCVTESMATRTLALPFFNEITESQIMKVCESLREVLQ